MNTATKSRPTSSRFADRALIALEALVGIAVVAAIVGKSYGPATTVIFIFCGGALAFSAYTVVKMGSSLRDRTLDVTGRIEDEARDALEHEKNLLLQGIKELEADYAIGKVASEDYAHLRQTSERRAMAIIGRLKRSDDEWLEKAEALVEKRIGPIAKRTAVASDDSAGWKAEDRAARDARRALASMFDDRPAAMTAVDGDLVCGACETHNDEDASYCVGCGRPKEEVAA